MADETPRCPSCGNPIEPEYVDTGLCGDCYWDLQTDQEGTLFALEEPGGLRDELDPDAGEGDVE